MGEREPPRHRSAYAAFQTIATRWNDNDQYGHIYNAVYLELFDCAMNGWQHPHGLLDRGPGGTISYVVENGCVYFRQACYPDVLEIGLRLAALGRSSLRLEMGMFRAGEESECARAHFSLVCVDEATRRPVPYPESQRTVFAKLRVGPG